MFEWTRRRNYLECGDPDMSGLLRRGHVGALKANTEHESEHALRGRCDCDLFLDCDLEPLRVRGDGNKRRFGASGLPVSFQT